MCEAVDVELALPRRCGRQQHRSNMPGDTPSAYYRRQVSIPLLDHMLTEIDRRFGPHQKVALQGLCLVPSVMLTMSAEDAKTKAASLAEMYREDLSGDVQAEVHCWRVKWQQQSDSCGSDSLGLPCTPTQALSHAGVLFPNIRKLLCILCTLPVTTCSSERSHSGLKRIKTTLRSTMSNTRLSSLSLLHLHQDIPINKAAVIDEFARRHPRRLQMANILADK